MDVIAHGSSDANATRWTFALQPRHDVHSVAMEVGALGDHVADVDSDAKADGPIGGLVAVIVGRLPLHFYRTLHRTIDAVEDDK